MPRPLPSYYNNPTTRRLAWLRGLFYAPKTAVPQQGTEFQSMPSSEINPQPGALLIAPPMMHDPNFRRTVVLLCEYGPEGSFGLILNRPLGLPLCDVMPSIVRKDMLISAGGPVQPDTLHFLHRNGDLVPDAIPLLDDVFWGGDFDILKVLLESKKMSIHNLRFFLGYSGWSTGQLEEEIEQGGWITHRADTQAIFKDYGDDLWRYVLRKMGGEYAVLANFPENPRMN